METIKLAQADEFGLTGSWVLMCLIHGNFIQDTNKKRLAGWKAFPGQWCYVCGQVGAA